MRIRIEHVEDPGEEEVVIRCAEVNDTVQRIHSFVREQGGEAPKVVFYKLDPDTRQSQEYYFPLDDVLFFETENETVFAHTPADAYRTKLRLYELEELLPRHFTRTAKSTIVNIRKIYSIKRDLTSGNCIQFANTHKQVYASRRYYSALKLRMKERN